MWLVFLGYGGPSRRECAPALSAGAPGSPDAEIVWYHPGSRAMRTAYILAGARTPFATWAHGRRGDGSPGGALKTVDPFELGAAALRGALRRSRVPAERLDLLVFGNMYAVGAHACYGARYVGWKAGIPWSVPALTVNMACGSGLHALIAGAQAVRDGADFVGIGGADNISMLRRDAFLSSFHDLSCGKPIGWMTEELAKEYGISRGEQDRWALRSHQSALRARAGGKTSEEIVEVGGVKEDDAVLVAPSLEHFREERGVFHGVDGTLTRANAHAMVDGASSLILAVESAARESGGPALGRLVLWTFVATPPERMGTASVPAVRRLLESAGISLGEVDLFEINETFAAQVLIDLKELGVPEGRVNVNGGALAIGHPFAATGCRQVLSLLLELRRRGLTRGIASICVGGGQGVAVLVESIAA